MTLHSEWIHHYYERSEKKLQTLFSKLSSDDLGHKVKSLPTFVLDTSKEFGREGIYFGETKPGFRGSLRTFDRTPVTTFTGIGIEVCAKGYGHASAIPKILTIEADYIY